ncbi:MAG: hypothetical protein AAF590_02075 [Pseudomonadota bacterium]
MAAFTFSEPQYVLQRRSNKPSLIRRLLDQMIEARMVEANAYVQAQLMMLDDETLALHGIDRNEVNPGTHRPVAY